MNCQRVAQEIKAYIDGELRPWTRWLVARHIASCAECRREMEEMTELTNDVRNAQQVSAPQGLRDKVLGGLTFQPAGQPRKPFWLTYAGLAGTMVIIAMLAAVVYPVFQTVKSTSVAHKLASAPQTSGEPEPSVAVMPPQAKPALVLRESVTVRSDVKSKAIADLPFSGLPHAAASKATHAADSVAQPSTPANLLIIKTADLGIQVRDFQQANDEAVSIAKSVGGYVTDMSAESNRGVPTSGCLSMRVRAGSFERTLNRLAKLGKVTSRSINGEDVTGESVDLDSRLRNLRAEERQYLDIMNRAKRIPDVVTVTGELSRVRGEIEEAQGRLKYLKSAAAMSTINLSVSEKAKTQPHKSSIESTFGNAIASLGGTLSALASLAIWLLVYSPFWALPIALWLYARKRGISTQQQS